MHTLHITLVIDQMFRWLLPLCVLVFFGCTSTKEISGEYKSKKSNSFRELLSDKLNGKPEVVGVSLLLNSDSSYTLQTCAIISNGTWQLSNSKVSLVCQSKHYLIDSFNHKPEYVKKIECNQDTSYCYLLKNKLVKYVIIDNKKYWVTLFKAN